MRSFVEHPRIAVWVVAGFAASAVALLLPGTPLEARLFDLLNLLVAASAALCAAWRARRSVGRQRWSWWAMAASCAAWSIGQVCWLWLALTETYSYPSPADAAYLVFPVLAALGLVLHPSSDQVQRARPVLDALMTSLAIGLIIWRTALEDVAAQFGTGIGLGAAVTVAYPALDVLLLVLAVLALARTRLSLALLTAGLTAFAVADIAFVRDAALGVIVLTPIDLGWGLGFTAIALAALARPEALQAPFTTTVASRVSAVLPYVPAVVALILSLIPHLDEHPGFPDELTVGLVLLVLLLVRQYLTLRQNWRLTAQLESRQAQLHHQAFHDGLTGLANRALFLDRLEHAIALHDRDRRPVAVLFLDLDGFKAVNDSWGHAVGDALLVRVAERLVRAARPGDTVARLGGDEFALLLEDGAAPAATAALIIRALDEPFDIAGRRLDVGASVGVVECDDTAESADQLLARADAAMYTAKRTGGGRIVAAGTGPRPIGHERPRRAAGSAVPPDDRVELAYQPIVELDSGRIVGLQALARRDPATPVHPRCLLPEVADALLAEACDRLATWSGARSDLVRPLAVHLSVAPARLLEPGFASDAIGIAAGSGLVTGQLVLGVAGSGLVPHLTAARAATAELRRGGLAVSLDDFGDGDSSAVRLTDLELDSIRIGPGMIDGIDTDRRRATLLGGLFQLADLHALAVIAADVRSPAQLAALRRAGCRLAHGPALGDPVPAAAVPALLDQAAGSGVPAHAAPWQPARDRHPGRA